LQQQHELFQHPLKGRYRVVYTLTGGILLGGAWMLLGFVFCLSLVFARLGVFMLWSAPFVLALQVTPINVSGGAYISPFSTGVRIGIAPRLWIRSLYYFPLGLIVGILCSIFAYLLCITLLFQGTGVNIFANIPKLMTLGHLLDRSEE
jgi:hypothetical protein